MKKIIIFIIGIIIYIYFFINLGNTVYRIDSNNIKTFNFLPLVTEGIIGPLRSIILLLIYKGFIPCIRLNGTSDISWEKTGLIEEYKSIQWYDYTKIYKRALSFVNGELPSNYHLTYSLNEDNRKNAFDILDRGGNISAVFRKELPKKYNGFKVVNADDSDLRFLDGDNIIAGLLAKGKAKNDYSGFVLDS